MKQFSGNEQFKFWSKNKEPFKGDVVSGVVLSLSKKYTGREVIDVGAGSGALLANFKKRYGASKRIAAVDLVPKGKGVLKGDCTRLNFESNRFDTYFCLDVIEHLSDADLDKCLREANRVLKTGGYGVFTTMNDERLEPSTVVCPECGCVFHRWGHCQVFTESRVKNLFEKYGFEVVEVKKINLELLARLKLFARIFYFLKMNRLLKSDFLRGDLFFLVRKVMEFLNRDLFFIVKKARGLR